MTVQEMMAQRRDPRDSVPTDEVKSPSNKAPRERDELTTLAEQHRQKYQGYVLPGIGLLNAGKVDIGLIDGDNFDKDIFVTCLHELVDKAGEIGVKITPDSQIKLARALSLPPDVFTAGLSEEELIDKVSDFLGSAGIKESQTAHVVPNSFITPDTTELKKKASDFVISSVVAGVDQDVEDSNEHDSERSDADEG